MTIETQLTLFDYNALDTETRIVVQQRTSEIKALMKRAAQDIIDIGQKLIEVKGKLGHGNFMRVADAFKSTNFVEMMAPSALYLLAAPSTPEGARMEALYRAEQGEPITYSAAREIVMDHRAPAIPFVPDEDDEPLSPYEQGIAAQYAPQIIQPPANHQLINASTNNEWYTPASFVEGARLVMGHIDLDPASCEFANRTVRARVYHTIDDDGLAQEWYGKVWLNPPYGTDDGESNQARWSRRLMDEYQAGRVSEAILLVNAVPGNGWFVPLKRYPICFPDSRIRFYNEDTEAGQPTHSNALIYFGPNIDRFVEVFSQFGAVMAVREVWLAAA